MLSQTKAVCRNLANEINQDLPDWQSSKSCLFVQQLDRVQEKLSQHWHKEKGRLNVAVINLLIPLVKGG